MKKRFFRNKKQKNEERFTKNEKAIFELACMVEAIPGCEDNVKDVILNILGYELVKEE